MNTKNKTFKGLLSVISIVLLVALMAVALVACGSKPEPQVNEEGAVNLYWNAESSQYRSGKAARRLDSDGYYYVTFAFDGKKERMPVDGRKELVQKIDQLDVMGLVFNEEGVVTDAVRIDDCTGGYAAKYYYVSKVEDNTIYCNTAVSFDGVEIKLTYDENTVIYRGGTSGPLVGMAVQKVNVDDEIVAIKDEKGNITHIYVLPYEAPPDIYWNVTRMYNSTTGSTTRESDLTGTYVFDVVVNGELTQVKTRSLAVAESMDKISARCFALTFDEEGYVTEAVNASSVTGGGSVASWYHVTGVEGKNVDFTRVISPNAGSTASAALHKECKIMDVSGQGATMGEYTTLRYGDQVHCLKDARGQICYVFVISRLAESEIYWNVERMYDSKTKLSTRKPDGNGWYKFVVAVRGEQITVRTKDVDIANKIDGRAAKCFGITYDENNVITNFYTPDAVSGGGTFASWYIVEKLEGDQITMKKSTTGDVKSGKIAADCEIYNVSSNATMVGEVTEVKVGDEVHTLKNLNGEVCVIFVVTRVEDMPIYWNVTQMYNKNTKSTTRTREEDGYYHYEMCYNGETVTMRVKDKKVADTIDSQNAKCVAVKTSGDVILKAFHPKNALKTRNGSTQGSWVTVTSVSKSGYTAQKVTNGKVTDTFKGKFASGVKIYNVSTTFKSHRGEVSSISVGDTIHTLANKNDKVTYVFITSHTLNLDLGVYYNRTRKWDSTNSVTTRVPNADGEYEFQMAYNGEEITVKTKDIEVANAIDKEAAKCLCIEFDEETGYAIYANHAKNAKTANGGPTASYTTIIDISDDGKTATAEKVEGGKVTATYELKITDKTKVYNVSSRVQDHWAEETTLQVGDYVHGLKTADGNTAYLYVMTRPVPVVEHQCTHITEDVTWREWDGSHITASGYYVVTKDLELSARADINLGVEATLCLNGHTVKNTDRFFRVFGKLTICDHKLQDGTYAGKMETSASGSSTYGALAYLYNENNGTPTLTIEGGNFVMTGQGKEGGLVYIGNKTAANGGGVGLVKLMDGVLTGHATGSGGAVAVTNNCAFEMYGGTITGSTSQGAGGAVFVSGNTSFTMYGGTITGNTATGNGGALNVDNGEFTMLGGQISNNTAAEGGNIRIGKKGIVNLQGDALVTGGSANNGGNITMFGILNVSQNAKITNGTASGEGSAISVFCNYDDGAVEVNVYGGTIDGTIRYDGAKGTAVMNLLGGSVDTINYKKVSVTSMFVGGNAQVKEIKVADGKTIGIHESGLEDTASIGVFVANLEKAFTTITDPADEACFHPVDAESYELVNVNNDLYMKARVTNQVHCLCGGAADGVGDHVCDATVEFQPWLAGDSLPASGNYYLTQDVTLGATVTVVKGETLNLCLNGKTVSSSVRVFKVYGTLSILDCQDTEGTITSSNTSLAPVLYAYEHATVNLYGGNLKATATVAQAGVLAMGGNTAATNRDTASVLNIYGGTISGGSVTGAGGNVSIFNGAWLNMYGGTISGGSAATKGGNVCIGSGSAYLVGGTITGGTAATGGGLRTDSGYGITVGGSIRIVDNEGGNLYLASGKTLTLASEPFVSDAAIGITMEAPGVFITTTDTTGVAPFASDDLAYAVQNNDGVLSLVETGVEPPVVDSHSHCVCGGDANGVGDHVCGAATTFLPWDAEANANYKTTLPASGSYYLTEDVNLTALHKIDAGKTLNLCLNGFTVNGAGGTKARVWNISGTLNLTDCDADGDGKVGSVESNYTGAYGGIFYTYNDTANSCFNLYNGTLRYTGTGVTNSAGIGRVANTKDNGKGTNRAFFNIYGGTLTGGKGDIAGGLFLDHSSVVNMYAGVITDCRTTGTGNKNGGAVYAAQYGTFNMFGGEITGNYATNAGGAIFLTGSNTTANIAGGRIYKNTGGGDGAGIYVGSKGNVIVSGTAYIFENTRTSGASGNIHLTAGKTLGIGQGGLTEGARVYVNLVSDDLGKAFATVTKATDADYIFSDKVAYDVALDTDNTLKMVAAAAHKHCICGGNSTDKEHVCFVDEKWTEVKDLTIFQTVTSSNVEHYQFPASGSYCLTEDLTTDKIILIGKDTEITLCLNGHTLTSAGRTFSLEAGGNATLNIADCQKDGTAYKGTIRGNTANTTTYGGVFYMYAGTTLNLYGGNLVANASATTLKSGGVGAVAGSDKTAMNMYDGTISGGKSTSNGGNIIIWDGAVMNVYGGTISGGHSNGGGNVAVSKGEFVLYGGTVSGGTSTGFGGNIRVGQDGGEMTMIGGTVTGGTAVNGGGNIYGNLNNGKKAKITISGGTITAGTLTGQGGSSYKGGAGLLNYGMTYMTGSPVIKDNNGDDYLLAAGTLKITGVGAGLVSGAEVHITVADKDLDKVLGTAFSADDARFLICDTPGYKTVVDADNNIRLEAVPAT